MIGAMGKTGDIKEKEDYDQDEVSSASSDQSELSQDYIDSKPVKDLQVDDEDEGNASDIDI